MNNATPQRPAHDELLDESWFNRPGRALQRADVLSALARVEGRGTTVIDEQFEQWFRPGE